MAATCVFYLQNRKIVDYGNNFYIVCVSYRASVDTHAYFSLRCKVEIFHSLKGTLVLSNKIQVLSSESASKEIDQNIPSRRTVFLSDTENFRL